MAVHEECGVFGVFAQKTVDAAGLCYLGLQALQHRGQESCGIVVNDDGVFVSRKDLGLVGEVLTADALAKLPAATMAVAHTRYGTTGANSRANCQPIEVNHQKGRMALAHNGNLSNAAELRSALELSGAIFHTSSDTETIAYIVTRKRLGCPSIEDALCRTMDTIEGAYSLILKRTSQLSGVVPVISLVLGVCAGSAAIAAAAADFVVMTEDAELFLTPAFEKGAGSAAAAAANGTAAAVEADEAAAIAKVRALVNLMPVNNMATVPCMEFDAPAAASGSDLEDYVASIADGGSVVALYEGFGGAAYTALATVAGTTVGIAATNKTDAKLTEDDCDKLARFMRTCDAFSIPVITLVDTLGFGGSVETELKGAVKAVTRLAGSYAEATTAKIAVVTGMAAGPLFVALAGKSSNSDFAYALEGTCIAPMAPESAVEFLWHDRLKGADDLNAKRKALAKEYAETVASADKAAALGVVDDVIGAADLRATVTAALSMLEGKRVTNLPKKHSNFPF